MTEEIKAKKLTTEEVCRELQIGPVVLTALRRELDGALVEKVRHPDYPGVQRLLWRPEAIEKLKALLEERQRREARRKEMLTSQEVCKLLKITPQELQSPLDVEARQSNPASGGPEASRIGACDV